MGDANDNLNKWVVTWNMFLFLVSTVQTTGIPDQIERLAGDLVLDRGPPKKITHAHIYVHKHMIIITSAVIIVIVII